MRQVTAQEKYKAVNEGMMAEAEFIRQMKLAFPQYISPANGYNDTVQILKNYGMLTEIKKEQDDTSKYSDDSLRRSIDIELEAMGIKSEGEVAREDIDKAKKKAIANLKKDPLHYYNLISGESSKVDKHDGYKETKRGKLEKDTFNDMKKATLKERKENLVEGTRALVGFLSGDRLTTTYNHYDGYPSNLGKGLEAHYNNDEAAKDVAMKGYITYMDPETGDIEATHNDAPGKVILPDDPEQRAREIAEEIDKFGADYGYVWDDESNQWITIKNTGIRSMIDQIMEKMAMVNVYSGEKMNEADPIPTEPGIPGERASNHDRKMAMRNIIDFLTKSGHPDTGYKVSNDDAISFIKTHKDDIFNGDIDHSDINDVWSNYDEFESVNRDSVEEKKGKDHDGDGDIDKDDYMAAKDKAIKKAMGKKVEEEFKQEYVADADEIRQFLEKKLSSKHDKAVVDEVYKQLFEGIEFLVDDQPGTGELEAAYSISENLEDQYYEEEKDQHLAVAQEITKLIEPFFMASEEVDELAVDRKGNPKPDSKPSRFKGRDKSRLRTIKELRGSGADIIEIIKAMAMEMDGDEIEAAMEVMEFIGEEFKIDFEFGRVGGGNYGRNQGNPYEGKLKEAVKAIITKSLEEEMINEAATQELARIADEYDSFDGLKPAVISLENIVTEIESFYDKTRQKIQKIYDDLGEVRNEEGLKVGAFITPAIENAFKKDLRPITKAQFHGGLKMPQIKRISQADVDRGYVQQEAPKQTVYSPVNEAEVKSHPDEIEDGTFPVIEAFKKVGIDMSKDVHIHETDGGTAGLGGGRLQDKGVKSAKEAADDFEYLRKIQIKDWKEATGGGTGEFPIIYEYYYLGDKTPEGTEFKMSFGIFEGTTWDIFQ